MQIARLVKGAVAVAVASQITNQNLPRFYRCLYRQLQHTLRRNANRAAKHLLRFLVFKVYQRKGYLGRLLAFAVVG